MNYARTVAAGGGGPGDSQLPEPDACRPGRADRSCADVLPAHSRYALERSGADCGNYRQLLASIDSVPGVISASVSPPPVTRDGLALDLGFAVLVHERALEHDLVPGSLLGDGDGGVECLARPRLLREPHAVRREIPDPDVVRDCRREQAGGEHAVPETEGRPEACAATSSWCIGLKSPDAPAYITRSVRVSLWSTAARRRRPARRRSAACARPFPVPWSAAPIGALSQIFIRCKNYIRVSIDSADRIQVQISAGRCPKEISPPLLPSVTVEPVSVDAPVVLPAVKVVPAVLASVALPTIPTALLPVVSKVTSGRPAAFVNSNAVVLSFSGVKIARLFEPLNAMLVVRRRMDFDIKSPRCHSRRSAVVQSC